MTSVNCEETTPRTICGNSDLLGYTPEPMVHTLNEGAVIVIFSSLSYVLYLVV